MPASPARHATNAAAIVALVILGIATLDHLWVWLGWPPGFGCWLKPLMLAAHSLAVGAVSFGLLFAVLPWTRPFGITLVIVGVLLVTLPGLLAGPLGVFCGHS